MSKTTPSTCLQGICWHAHHVRRQITADERPPWTGAKYVRAGKIVAAKVKDPREPRLQELLQSWYLFCLMREPEALDTDSKVGVGRVVCKDRYDGFHVSLRASVTALECPCTGTVST